MFFLSACLDFLVSNAALQFSWFYFKKTNNKKDVCFSKTSGDSPVSIQQKKKKNHKINVIYYLKPKQYAMHEIDFSAWNWF